MKSTMAESATVELINIFINHTDVATTEDKLDFIDFEKLFQPVSVYSEGDHLEPCKVPNCLEIIPTAY